jgi:hypothetical protein
MNAATSHDGSGRLIWISRLALIVGAVAFLFVSPLGYRPWYYVSLAGIGALPLVCGPALYRWFGSAFIVAALAFAVQEHRAGVAMKAQVEQITADSQAQQTQTHTP